MYFALMITDRGRPGVMFGPYPTAREAAEAGAKIIETYMSYLKDILGDSVADILEEEFEYTHGDYVEGVFIVQAEDA